MKVTVALLVITTPFNEPVMVAVTPTVEEVSVAVYVPSPLSVTGLSVPAVVSSSTESPPDVKSVPSVNLSWTVIVDVEEPSAVMVVGDAEIVDTAGSGSGVAEKITVASSEIESLFTEPTIVAVSAVLDAVSVAP
jgi:hypothetical protein